MAKKFYKTDLIESYADLANISDTEAERRISAIFDIIVDELSGMEDGDAVMLASFFNFHMRGRRAKKGNNPQTGAPMDFPPTKTIVTKPTQPTKDKIKGGK
jgi:DNA-binding protein HU-beta